MAQNILAKLAVQISANTAEFNSALKKSENHLRSFAKSANTLKNAFIGAFAFKGIQEISSAIIDVTAQFQKFEAVLTNGLGSRSAARVALNDITKFASTTPFEVSELTNAFIKWTNVGLKPTIEKLGQIGDVASSLGAGFEQTAEAFKDLAVGQTKRIEEIGIVATQTNGKIQLSFKGVNLQIDKSAQGVEKALSVYSQLPGVLGSSSAVSKTLTGQISNFKDNIDILAKSIGDRSSGLISSFLTFANDALGGLNDALNKNSDKLRTQQLELNVLVSSITNVNTSEAARKQLIQELNQKYPEFLRNLDAEKVSNEQLLTRMQDVNAQFLKKIALAAAEERLLEIQKKLNNAIDDEVEALKDKEELLRKNISYTPSGNPTRVTASLQNTLEIQNAETRIKNAKQEQLNLQDDLTEALTRYAGQALKATDLEFFRVESTAKTAENTAIATENLQKQLKVYNKISKIEKPILNLQLPEIEKKENKDPFGIKAFTESLKPGIEGLNNIQQKALNVRDIITKGNEDIKASFQQLAIDGIGLAAESLGKFFAGEKNIKFGRALIKMLADFMKMFGKQLLTMGTALVFTGDPILKSKGLRYLAAGAALIAGGAFASSKVAQRETREQEMASMAKNNTSFGTRQTGNNIEISGTLVGSGRDLVAIINNTNYDNKYRRGG